ncbi:hypothetical protein EMIHUDRAFT_225278 [Emiliania huxleyi CCMP1516]|uniref:4Fe-4S ferredoxin-type domain-containing protein n=2 Tax=Emiliania huxleyi TaxID=2903 RepID=A0A0D3KPK7_EMIH1|nr:hypothetical protein EMIHUDRAFT_225278 [Emiliania huxleyi CCMP1516]EOD37692.1 hypothetical protein EMIHUDRAFT_225278 [Emiliania huxleyi CCMP1516]|eukprot:XP_005790121.1 hypothetical protein EMIHUDRAFT_225278 [Emiliania huxleyi CCMP1516]
MPIIRLAGAHVRLPASSVTPVDCIDACARTHDICCGQEGAAICPTSCQPVIVQCTDTCPASLMKYAMPALTGLYKDYGEIRGKGYAYDTRENRYRQYAAEREVIWMQDAQRISKYLATNQ